MKKILPQIYHNCKENKISHYHLCISKWLFCAKMYFLCSFVLFYLYGFLTLLLSNQNLNTRNFMSIWITSPRTSLSKVSVSLASDPGLASLQVIAGTGSNTEKHWHLSYPGDHKILSERMIAIMSRWRTFWGLSPRNPLYHRCRCFSLGAPNTRKYH